MENKARKTDRDLMIKGVRFLTYTVILMFTAPVVVFQAFKNQAHPLYMPVLVLGLIFGLGAIIMGFLGIKTIVDALLGKKKKT